MSRLARIRQQTLESGRTGSSSTLLIDSHNSHDEASISSNISTRSGVVPPLFGFKLTGFRLITILSTSGFGIVKAILSYLGQSTAPTTLDWIFGVFLTLILGGIWWRKEDVDESKGNSSRMHELLFEKDYGIEILVALVFLRRSPSQLFRKLSAASKRRTRFVSDHDEFELDTRLGHTNEQGIIATGIEAEEPFFGKNLRRRFQPPAAITFLAETPIPVKTSESQESSNRHAEEYSPVQSRSSSLYPDEPNDTIRDSMVSADPFTPDNQGRIPLGSPTVMPPSEAKVPSATIEEVDIADAKSKLEEPPIDELQTGMNEYNEEDIIVDIESMKTRYESSSSGSLEPVGDNRIGCAYLKLFRLSNKTEHLNDAIVYLTKAVLPFNNGDIYHPSHAICASNLAVALRHRFHRHDEPVNSEGDLDEIVDILKQARNYTSQESDIKHNINGLLGATYLDRWLMLNQNVNSKDSDDLDEAIFLFQGLENLKDGRFPAELCLLFADALTYRYQLKGNPEDYEGAIRRLQRLQHEDYRNQDVLISMGRTYTERFKRSRDERMARNAHSCLKGIKLHPDLARSLHELGIQHLQSYFEWERGSHVIKAVSIFDKAFKCSLHNDPLKLLCSIDLSIAHTLNGSYDRALTEAQYVITRLNSNETDRSNEYKRLHDGLTCSILQEIGLGWHCPNGCSCLLRTLLNKAQITAADSSFESLHTFADYLHKRIEQNPCTSWLACSLHCGYVG
ncbi:hypothetical protein M422DRAFT_65102 [Sphaerobolus stellatus SS14]|nr:hypothetical protein M422DRAFT_65102 [Sphaerobolus stellatus SS14]